MQALNRFGQQLELKLTSLDTTILQRVWENTKTAGQKFWAYVETVGDDAEPKSEFEDQLGRIFDISIGDDVPWPAIKKLNELIQVPADAYDVLSHLEVPLVCPDPYPTLLAFTVLDTLTVNNARFRDAVSSRGWSSRLLSLASTLPSAAAREAASQLISNWSTAEGSLGDVFSVAVGKLRDLNITVPEADPVPVGGGAFVQGTNFLLEMQNLEEAPPLSARAYQPTEGHGAVRPQVEQFMEDVKRLKETVDRIAEDPQNLSLIQRRMNEAEQFAHAVERWMGRVQTWLYQVKEERLTRQVLEWNDIARSLQEKLRQLYAMGAGQVMTPREEMTAVIEADHRPQELQEDRVWRPEVNHAEMEKLREQIKQLEHELDEAQQDAKAELDKARQEHEVALAEEKAQFAGTIKRLETEKEQLQNKVSEGTVLSEANRTLEEEISALQVRVQDAHMELAEEIAKQEHTQRKHELELAEAKALADKRHREIKQLREDNEQIDQLKLQADHATQALSDAKVELRVESIARKRLYNELREMKGNIRVLMRIRPVSAGANQQDKAAKVAVTSLDEYSCNLTVPGRGGDEDKRYEFDTVFDQPATQPQVYSEVKDLVQSALDGYNVCIFCYGQTGSGKTYTMTGSDSNPGIIPRACADLFNMKDGVTIEAQGSMLELYQEKLLDLLGEKDGTKLVIKASPKGQVIVEGAVLKQAKGPQDLKSIFQEGLSRRTVAATKMNFESSRSHLVFTMFLEIQDAKAGTKASAKLTFVDLAGSERVGRSGAVDDKTRLDEAKAINKSLSALGDVVSALTSGEKFIPYRNHRLTELMKDSLGGNAKTLMIVNVSALPGDATETKNSLDYANRVKEVTNNKSRNFETAEIARLHQIISNLKKGKKGKGKAAAAEAAEE